jgi:type I restriction enzyme S subunit
MDAGARAMKYPEVALSYLSAIPITNGLGEAAADGDEEWARYIRTTDIVSLFTLDRAKRVTLPPEVSAKAMLEPGDILMTAAGSLGTSYYYDGHEPACYAGYLVRFRPDPSRLDGRYAAYWTQSQHHIEQIETGAVRSTIDNYSAGRFRRTRIPLPSVGEQRRIADFLDDQTTRIDQIVTQREQQIDAVTNAMGAFAFASVTGQAWSERKRSGIPWAPDLPVGWGAPRVNQVARMGTGHTPSRSVPEYWVDCDIPWLTTSDVHKFRRDEIDVLDATEIQISGLGLANSAAVLHPRGTVALSRTASAGFSIVMGRDMATSQDFATWTCGSLLDSQFLLWCLRAMRRDLLRRLAMGSTHKTIYFPDLMSIRVPLPPLAAQRDAVAAITGFVADARRAKTEIGRSIDLLREFKRSLISAAVSGEFDVSAASGRGVPV